jgi:hypothetical protein
MGNNDHEVGRGDPADPARLRQIHGSEPGELLACLGAEMPHPCEIESLRHLPLEKLRLPLDGDLLSRNIAGVLRVASDLLRDLFRHLGQLR